MKTGFYQNYGKRIFDVIAASMMLIILSPVFLLLAVCVRLLLGSPVIFKQKRPGLQEKIFEMKKFRSMTESRDKRGKLLPDEERLTRFGKWLRDTSLDELPELFNVLAGDMSLIGPRPQLVKDLVFMDKNQRKRHCVKPGITGLAQINGRNAISWEEKLWWDVRYVKRVSLKRDCRILFKTVEKVLKREGITADNMATAEDYGDYLLRLGKIDSDTYWKRLKEVKELLDRR